MQNSFVCEHYEEMFIGNSIYKSLWKGSEFFKKLSNLLTQKV